MFAVGSIKLSINIRHKKTYLYHYNCHCYIFRQAHRSTEVAR
jgi:hypothetical protein